MSKPFVPRPDDEFRGVIEVDCSEYISPELKAKLRIGKFVPVVRSEDTPPDEKAPPSPQPDNPPGTSE